MTEPIVSTKSVVKSYEGVVAVDRVDFTVYPGEVVGLVGKNGAGKSTLVKMLAGAQQADAGEIHVNGERVPTHYAPYVAHRLGLAFMHQELANVGDMSVAENIVLGSRYPKIAGILINRRALYRKAAAVLEEIESGIDPKAKVGDLSKAQQRIVMIARALHHDARLLVLDEPSASLTENEVEHLHTVVARLRTLGRSVLYVSHRLQEILAITDRVFVMRDGAVVMEAPASSLDESLLIHAIVGMQSGDADLAEEPAGRPATDSQGELLLRVRGLSAPAVRDVSFDIHAGEIVGLAGLVGSGRSEVVRAIFAADHPSSGSVELRGAPLRLRSPRDALRAGIALLPEDRRHESLIPTFSVVQNVTLASLENHRIAGLPVPSRSSERRATQKLVELLSIRTSRVDQEILHLSGGNQQKVVLAKWLEKNVEVLLFDEPTIGVDVGAKQEVFTLIKDMARSGKGVVFISSDMGEMAAMCDRVIVMREGFVVGELSHDEISEERIVRLCYEQKAPTTRA